MIQPLRPALAALLLALPALSCAADSRMAERLPWPPPGADPAACSALEAAAAKAMGLQVRIDRFQMSRGRVRVFVQRVVPPGVAPNQKNDYDYVPVKQAAQACLGSDVEVGVGVEGFVLESPSPAERKEGQKRKGLRERLGRLLESLGTGLGG